MRRTPLAAALLSLVSGAALTAPTLTTADAAEPAYSVTTLHFEVTVGPDDDQVCDVVGDLYVPATASSTRKVPAILTTNGFGGSKNDQAGIGKTFASRGYAVLSYSGLGFGGSGCRITLDDPDWDGKAGRQLVGYLGGKSGVAFIDAAHTQPAPVLTMVQRDTRDHLGRVSTNDPRVGMVGGSYGGGIQFATASVDPRVDTIVPLITWNYLPYSLDPNNTAQITNGQTTGVTTSTPGAIKLFWGLGFSGLGLTGDLKNGQVPGDPLPCPNFADWVCPALVTAGTTGFFQPDATAAAHHASVASYLPRIKIPTLLIQGENDTLFNLNEAIATYRALQTQGAEVKMIWQSWGHSGPAAPGEIDLADLDPAAQYETGRVLNWFEHHLKGRAVGTGPEFSYFRPWVSYTGNAAPAYASSTAFPVGTARTWKLSGTGALRRGTPAAGSQSFVTAAAGLPTSLNPFDVLGSYAPLPNDTLLDLPGTFAAWSTPALTAKLDVVGSPVVNVRVQAPTAAVSQATGPAGQLVLFVKLVDVGPDGKGHLIKGLEAPIRIPDVTRPVKVTLPAIVHRFAAGHRLQLVVAGGSVNYRAGLTPMPVTIASGSDQTLVLPVVP